MDKDEMLVLTPSGLVTFLTQIEELEGLDMAVSVNEAGGSIDVKIGESVYSIQSPQESVIEVTDDVVDELDTINEEGYTELAETEGIEMVEDDEVVEGGIIKELIKTLAVGGLVRLTKNAIMNS